MTSSASTAVELAMCVATLLVIGSIRWLAIIDSPPPTPGAGCATNGAVGPIQRNHQDFDLVFRAVLPSLHGLINHRLSLPHSLCPQQRHVVQGLLLQAAQNLHQTGSDPG